MRDEKRRGRGEALAAIGASSCVQGPSLATVALEGKTYAREEMFRRTDREPVRREVSHHAGDGIFDRGPSGMAMADL